MRQWLTGEDLANLFDMLRTTDHRAFLVLEGESDCRALDSHVDPMHAETFPAGSKSVATRVLELVDERRLRRVLVILDRDWVGLLTSPETSRNVVYTDEYDLDATMLFSRDVFDRVVISHSDRDRRRSHAAASGANPRDLAILFASHVGVLRYASERDRLHISCSAFPLHTTLTDDRDSVDVDRLALIAVARSTHCAASAPRIAALVRLEHGNVAGNLSTYCAGHDLARAISALVKHWGGTAGSNAIEDAVRSSFSCADLHATQLYGKVVAWADQAGAAVWSCPRLT